MNCENSGQPINRCTCSYCTIAHCPMLDKSQCPVKALWDKVEMVEHIGADGGIHVVNVGRISQN